jgi:radical SAM-linked protein
MTRRQPEGPQSAPIVQRVRLRYAKRGRLRFSSHRDFARAFERALRRAAVPMAFSSGFTKHPRISYLGAAPTGVASEAEYVEIGLDVRVDVEALRAAIDSALPDGLDIVEAVEASTPAFADRMQASLWRLELPGVSSSAVRAAVAIFLATDECLVQRLTKDGRRELDARAAVLRATVLEVAPIGASVGVPGGVSDHVTAGLEAERAILELAIRQVIPTVRPDDVLEALRSVAGLALDVPPQVVRLAQGPLDGFGAIGDPLADDRAARAN